MISRKVLEELLREPLGPYRDRDVLHETACQMKGNRKLVLYSFVLDHGGHVIGLDESETRPQGQDYDDRKFRFRGILKIANLDWLSDFGIKTVETELNLRANERALREGERVVPRLTLQDLVESRLLTRSDDSTWQREDELKLAILIQGEKNLPAVFMHSAQVPDGLLWCSKAHNRVYQVATMDVETYSRSENFFWQWRLLALMKKICEQNPFVDSRKRTPRWFVDRYIAGFAHPDEDRYRRLIFDDEDTDVDETGKTVTPRHLLVPHMSEILGLFAAYAGWLITNNEVRRKKLFDIVSWQRFAQEARKQRKEAARQGVRWGWREGEEGYEESSEEDGDSEALHDRLARENPVTGKEDRVVARKLELARARSERGKEQGFSYISDSASEDDAPGGARYMSDFSELSEVGQNDSDYRFAEEEEEEEEAVNQIPWQLQRPPLLPDVDGRWWCPLPECDHHIDLHVLRPEDGTGVPEELIEYIIQKEWRNAVYDPTVLQGFERMVKNHYFKHFEERGVRAERREGRIRFVFIRGRRRRHVGGEPIRGPMPVRGTLGGESRVVPIVHAPQAGHFQ